MTQPAIVPLPSALRARDGGPFVLTAATALRGDPDAVAALRALITARTGLRLPDGAAEGAAPDSAAPDGARAVVLVVDAASGAAESYTLRADAAGVSVTGADAAGLFYGVQTLGQLLQRGAGDGGWSVPAVEVDDAPRFPYRGVMLDVARHFHDVDTVEAYIDRAASLKLNVLHLHLSDDQGWRLEIASRPELTARAAASAVGGDPGGFFTQDDYRRIVAFAASRHMTVVPEFDTPGHTHAVSLAYPELSAEPVLSDHIRQIIRDYGGELPVNGTAFEGMAVGFSSLKIHDEATYAFLEDVFGELAALTPGPWLHLGGDEALGTSPEDFDVFVARASEIIRRLGKTPMAWHEAGSAAGLARGTVGQYWGFVSPTGGMDAKARAFVARGGKIVFSPADAIYLDMKFDADSPLGLTWARGVTSARRAYEWDPATVVDGIGDDDILGVEAPLWTETVRSLADIDALAFPRITAAAEAAWSPAVGTDPARTWESFRTRVGALGPLWQSLGIAFTALDEIDWRDEEQ
ncbi:beta-N-acetylhexosaminidase [Microbacterium sp. W1N]|uniref:beta-N-acetylhexosaminidase n=1 Tax=Microbacterium festucae TaxID=2977531 RepID=UPI0021C04C64|nr:beta-N-acetylhexosaminidase [Microbacterium festucae]MCT9818854.1 beta-N-acetylhexosaminidase [Microbacterium festucae]